MTQQKIKCKKKEELLNFILPSLFKVGKVCGEDVSMQREEYLKKAMLPKAIANKLKRSSYIFLR